jgi:hypothetical protein
LVQNRTQELTVYCKAWQVRNGFASLSHIGHWQGDQARYVGSRKNLFDLRRAAVVHNLHVLAKNFTHATEQSATLS